MNFLEVLQFVGYTTGAALHLWMGVLLLRARRKLARLERVLLVLTTGFGLWHLSNLVIAFHAALGLSSNTWSVILKAASTVAIVSISFSYSFLLHAHLHLWANAQGRSFKWNERLRVYTSYLPILFLGLALPQIWRTDYAPMMDKMQSLTLPLGGWANFLLLFALWAGYVLIFVAVTELIIARRIENEGEKRSLQTIAASFILLAILTVGVYGLGIGGWGLGGRYLRTLNNLGSLLPSALIAYYIYRYRFLALEIEQSLIVAAFAVIVLVIYLFGIRTFGEWLSARYGVRPGAVESLMILALALASAPLKGWLQKRLRELFTRETDLYRQVIARIGAHGTKTDNLREFLSFVEQHAIEYLKLKNLKIRLAESATDDRNQAAAKREDAEITEENYQLAYPLTENGEVLGEMLITAEDDELAPEKSAVLEVLSGQVAATIARHRLIDEKLALERRLAHGERLAALGQMAATVAHEIKNPLSAIKSIAQVMREDERFAAEYERDLSLIVGETDRLSGSVTQLLSFARYAPVNGTPLELQELLSDIQRLFAAAALKQSIAFKIENQVSAKLDGKRAALLRDAVGNLVANALQAAPHGGRVTLAAAQAEDKLLITVTDDGAGVPSGLREKIWTPFFTTKQRGTGLGLAIVRKRIEDADGTVYLASENGGGARFVIELKN